MANENKKITFGLSDAELASALTKNPAALEIAVEDGDKKYYALCRYPSFNHLTVFENLGKQDKNLEAIESLFSNCVIAADSEIKENDVYKMQVVTAITSQISTLKGFVKK